MQGRIESAIGVIKQHARIALATAHAPTRFWTHTVTDYIQKKSTIWALPDRNGKRSTPHSRMQHLRAPCLP
jgi:hypothetical protein